MMCARVRAGVAETSTIALRYSFIRSPALRTRIVLARRLSESCCWRLADRNWCDHFGLVCVREYYSLQCVSKLSVRGNGLSYIGGVIVKWGLRCSGVCLQFCGHSFVCLH